MRELPVRRWIAVGLVGLVGAALGVLFGLGRPVVYSLTATLSSARVAALPEAIPGYVVAATSLASTYSRITMTDAVEAPVARRLGLSLAAVQNRITATPVPEDPVLRIVGTGPTATAARRITSATAVSLVHYVTGLVGDPSAQGKALSQYATITAAVQALDARIGRLRALHPGAALRPEEMELAKLSLRLKDLASAYVNGALNMTSGAAPQILTASAPATSDRRSKAEDYGAVGLGAALIIALAIERAAWARRRARRYARLQAV